MKNFIHYSGKLFWIKFMSIDYFVLKRQSFLVRNTWICVKHAAHKLENSCGILLAPYASGRHKKVRNLRAWSFPIEGSDTRRFSEGPARNSKVPLRPRANGDFVCLDLRQGRSPSAEAGNRPRLPLGWRSLAALSRSVEKLRTYVRTKRYGRRPLRSKNAHQGLVNIAVFSFDKTIVRHEIPRVRSFINYPFVLNKK